MSSAGIPFQWQQNPQAYLTDVIGSPVRITSGQRTPQQNAAVGGVPNSAHLSGQAFDFVPQGMTMAQAASQVAQAGVPFDQDINEGNHVHISFDPRNRGQVFSMNGGAPVPQGAAPSQPASDPTVDQAFAMAGISGNAAPSQAPQASPNDPSVDQAFNMYHSEIVPRAISQSPKTAITPTPGSALESFVRGAANGGSFNLADMAAAAGDAAIPLDSGSSSAPTFSGRYQQNIANQSARTAADQQAHPYATFAGNILGGMINPINRFLPTPSTLGGAVLQGGGMGAAYGAGAGVSKNQKMGDILSDSGIGGLTGGALGAGTYGLSNLISGATRSPEAQMLTDEGVPLTIGQNSGGTTHTLEDASTHIPMMGNAIKSRQTDAIIGFNRAAYNRVLEPLGLQYAFPKDAPIGNDGVQRIGQMIGKAYDDAYDGATIQQTPNFSNSISQAVQDASDLLPKERATQIAQNINNRLVSKFDQTGTLQTPDLIQAKNWFAEQSRAGPMASLDEKAMASAYGSVVDAIKDGIAENDSDKGALLNAADNSYMRYVKISQAASQNAASGRGGVFTPAQLGAAIRSTDNSTRRMNFAQGVAPMQDLAQAGQKVLPSTVPDSGTAIRGLMDAAPWLGMTALAEPEYAAAAVGGIGAGTAAYSRSGQQILNGVIYGSPARKAMGQIPLKMIPAFAAALSGHGLPNP